MKKQEIKVCVCTQCVLNGAMDIVESIESLQKLKSQLRLNTSIKVIADESFCDKSKKNISPVVSIDGEILENATSEMVTAHIIHTTMAKDR